MIRDPIIIKLVNKQIEDFNNGALEEVHIKNYKDIIERQKELMKNRKE